MCADPDRAQSGSVCDAPGAFRALRESVGLPGMRPWLSGRAARFAARWVADGFFRPSPGRQRACVRPAPALCRGRQLPTERPGATDGGDRVVQGGKRDQGSGT